MRVGIKVFPLVCPRPGLGFRAIRHNETALHLDQSSHRDGRTQARDALTPHRTSLPGTCAHWLETWNWRDTGD